MSTIGNALKLGAAILTAPIRVGLWIIGFRSREHMFWEDRFRAYSDRLIVTTNDGSYGRQGFVTAALQDVLERDGLDTRVMTAIRMEELAEPYIRRRAMRHLEKGRCVVFAGGTGNPYFSTDTAAVLRAIQMKADVIIKTTNVDGIYSADPKKDASATRYDRISYRDVMLEELGVMDQTAITLCKENSLPLIVLNINTPDAVADAIRGEPVGTLVS